MPLAGELSRIGAGTQGSADRGSTARAGACVDLVLSNELRSEIRCLEIGACDGDHRLCACIKLWTGPNRPAAPASTLSGQKHVRSRLARLEARSCLRFLVVFVSAGRLPISRSVILRA